MIFISSSHQYCLKYHKYYYFNKNKTNKKKKKKEKKILLLSQFTNKLSIVCPVPLASLALY